MAAAAAAAAAAAIAAPTEGIDIQLTDAKLDVGAAIAAVVDPAAGGIGSFIGTTRNHHGGRLVATLSYEAYAPMARRLMRRLAEAATARYELNRCLVWHRLGEVPVGEVSVVIACSSVHRAEALEAASHLIDELKVVVPIWKLESYVVQDQEPAGDTVERVWKANCECGRRLRRPPLLPDKEYPAKTLDAWRTREAREGRRRLGGANREGVAGEGGAGACCAHAH